METIIFPASAGRVGKAVQNDSRRKTVWNSVCTGRNRWKHLCALRARATSSEKRRSTGSGRTNDQRGSCKQILRGGHWTYIFANMSRRNKGILRKPPAHRAAFSHSLPLVAPIRLSMPPEWTIVNFPIRWMQKVRFDDIVRHSFECFRGDSPGIK